MPLEDVKKDGITLTHAACLSRCNGARVDLHRYGTFTLDELRQQVGTAGPPCAPCAFFQGPGGARAPLWRKVLELRARACVAPLP